MRHDLYRHAMTHPAIRGGRGCTSSRHHIPFTLGKSLVEDHRVNVVAAGDAAAVRQSSHRIVCRLLPTRYGLIAWL